MCQQACRGQVLEMPNSLEDAHDFGHVEFRRVNKGFMHFSQVSYLSFPIK